MKNKNNLKKGTAVIAVSVCTILALTGCSSNTSSDKNSISNSSSSTISKTTNTTSLSSSSNSTKVTDVSGAIYSASDLFTSKDLSQTANLTNATNYIVSDNTDIHISSEGTYVLTGTAKNVTIYIEAGSEDKVQLVLDNLYISNDSMPCIYVKTADKVFVTTTNSSNTLIVSGTFSKDGSTNLDGVIFSKSDITLNGTGTLNITSTDNGIVGKDDLKITGGTYNITASSKAIESNDSIRIADGTFVLNAGSDGLHAENDNDNSLGYIYIGGGTFTITAKDDGIHAQAVIQIDNGNLTIKSGEGLEGTYIQINGGTINITATDDGINAAKKSTSYTTTFELNDGNIKITMSSGDTDGVDSNGNIIINGGTIDVSGSSTFDYDGTAQYNGGTIIVNGSQVTTIPNQIIGGGMNGGNMKGGKK